jgi:hypothetical protein
MNSLDWLSPDCNLDFWTIVRHYFVSEALSDRVWLFSTIWSIFMIPSFSLEVIECLRYLSLIILMLPSVNALTIYLTMDGLQLTQSSSRFARGLWPFLWALSLQTHLLLLSCSHFRLVHIYRSIHLESFYPWLVGIPPKCFWASRFRTSNYSFVLRASLWVNPVRLGPPKVVSNFTFSTFQSRFVCVSVCVR